MAIKQLVVREVKAALKNPAFILSLVLLFVFYVGIGGVTRAGISHAIQEAMSMKIALVLEEETEFVRELIKTLNVSSGGGVKLYPSVSEALSKNQYVIVFPKGFTYNATSPNASITLKAFIRVEDLSQTSLQVRVGAVQSVSSILSKLIPKAIATLRNISLPPEKYVNVESYVTAFGKTMTISQFNSVIGFSTAMTFIIAFVMGMTTSTAASNTAMEKAEKAFEMLLSQPIPRRNIVLAKIIGAVALATLTGAVYLVAMYLMLFLMTYQPRRLGQKQR